MKNYRDALANGAKGYADLSNLMTEHMHSSIYVKFIPCEQKDIPAHRKEPAEEFLGKNAPWL